MITITLDQIRRCNPCKDGWERIVEARTRNGVVDYYEAFPLAEALGSNGLDDTVWALRCVPKGPEIAAEFAAFCAEQASRYADAADAAADADAAAAAARAVRAEYAARAVAVLLDARTVRVEGAADAAHYAAVAATALLDAREEQVAELRRLLTEE